MLNRAIAGFVDDVTGLLKNARKMVFILTAVAVVAFTATGKLGSDDFIKIALMVFTYFFASTKDESNGPVG